MEHANPAQGPGGGRQQEIEITLNQRPVTVFGERHTGLDIKKAAVAQGVPIGLDFALGVLRSGRQQPAHVADSEYVSVLPDMGFVATSVRDD